MNTVNYGKITNGFQCREFEYYVKCMKNTDYYIIHHQHVGESSSSNINKTSMCLIITNVGTIIYGRADNISDYYYNGCKNSIQTFKAYIGDAKGKLTEIHTQLPDTFIDLIKTIDFSYKVQDNLFDFSKFSNQLLKTVEKYMINKIEDTEVKNYETLIDKYKKDVEQKEKEYKILLDENIKLKNNIEIKNNKKYNDLLKNYDDL